MVSALGRIQFRDRYKKKTEVIMLEELIEARQDRSIIRRVSKCEGDEARDIELLQSAISRAVLETLDWEGEVEFSRATKQLERQAMEDRVMQMSRFFGVRGVPTLELQLHPGIQFIAPAYDRWWAVGSGVPFADYDGQLFVAGGDGFSAAGFGLFLEADEEGIASIYPQGQCNSSWFCTKDSPRVRSKAGAGVVVYHGANELVSRQPILWDVASPKYLTGKNYQLPFGEIMTPPAPGSFGSVPVAPVLAPIGPGRRLLVWFYHWHLGANIKDSGFGALIYSKVPLVTVSFGKDMIIK
jgi:hypothetical protein